MATEAEQTGAAVAETITQQTETVKAGAEEAIAEAQRRADESAANARAISDAAMATELGGQIRSQNERLDAWQREHELTRTEVSKLSTTVQEQGTALGAILGRLTSTPPQSEATPQQSEHAVQTDGSSIKTEPNAEPKDQAEPHPEEKKKSVRYLL